MRRSSKIVPIVFPKIDKVYDEKECSICLADLDCDGSALPCGHVFHSQCILKWMESHRTCPVCRIRLEWTIIKDTSSCCK